MVFIFFFFDFNPVYFCHLCFRFGLHESSCMNIHGYFLFRIEAGERDERKVLGRRGKGSPSARPSCGAHCPALLPRQVSKVCLYT